MSASEQRAGAALARLDEITRRLRRECPWDREQDERSIVPHTIEEAYELADAARSGDAAKMLDELGDVLFQVYFLALLLEERGSGDLEQVANVVTEKLVRRHPHVFAAEATDAATEVRSDRPADSAAAVLGNWDQIKREVEGRGVEDPFADVPENLPGLLYARKLLRRAESAESAATGSGRAADGADIPGENAEPNTGEAGDPGADAERFTDDAADLGASAERFTDPARTGAVPELPARDHRRALEQARQALGALAQVAPPVIGADAEANAATRDELEWALGDTLLALVDAARLLRVDPELALRATADGLRGAASKS